MRRSKERVRHIAESLAARLHHDGHIELVGDRKAFVEALDHAIRVCQAKARQDPRHPTWCA